MVFDSDDTEAVGTAKVQIAMRYVQHILLDLPSNRKNDIWYLKDSVFCAVFLSCPISIN